MVDFNFLEMFRRCSKSIQAWRSMSLTRPSHFNNYQEFGSDALPSRSFINSLFCQQVDVDWLNLYPTLPTQELANIISEEGSRLAKMIGPTDSLEMCTEMTLGSLLLDVVVPVEYGGDPGPAGSSGMLQERNVLISRSEVGTRQKSCD